MKFSCERCQTRYSIGDEKVKGKVLKIRCKTCGNIIVVREQLPTVQGEASGYAVPQQREAAMAALQQSSGVSSSVSSSSSASSSSPMMSSSNPSLSMPPQPQRQAAQLQPAPDPDREYEWYVAIKGKQHGPANSGDIARLYREGKITERTYLWHDQMPSWTRIKDLPEFAALLAEPPAPRRGPPPPPSEDGAEIVNFEAARAQRQGQQQQQHQHSSASNLGPVTHDPFAAIQTGPTGGDNAPRESTRVFIMQAGLHNRAAKQKVYAGAALAIVLGVILLCVVDYQLDILGLKSVVNAVAVSTGIKAEPIDEGAAWGDAEADPTIRCKLQPNPAECVKQETAKIAKRRKARQVASGGGVSDSDLNGAFGTGGEAGAGSGGIGRAAGGIDENGFANVGSGLSSEEINKRLGGGKAGPTGPRARIETPDVAGTTIDAENAGKVVREGQPAIQDCVDAAMKHNEDIPAKLRMTLSITTKGVVERAKVNDAVTAASGLGGCLSKAARRWKFAPPTEPADLEIPLVLR